MSTSIDQYTLSAASLKESQQQKKRKRFLRADEADKWQEHFEDLCKFRRKHAHCLVPHTYPANPGLGRWVKRQRYENKLLQQKKVSSMTPERLELLEKIGFVWDSHESAWKEKLEELINFKKVHGTCNVPYYYPANPQLATWATRQRRQYTLYNKGKPSSMTQARIQALDDIGFKWQMRVLKKDTKKQSDQKPGNLKTHTQGSPKINHKICSDKITSAPNETTWQSRLAALPVDLMPFSDPSCGSFCETDGRMFLEVLSDLSSQDGSIAEVREAKPPLKKARIGTDEGNYELSVHEGILSDVLGDLSVASEDDERELSCSTPEPFSLDYITVDMDFIHNV